ncbi:DUF1214 domain-containing protein [Aquabacter spiritensis]|uniref:DUF1214 domain-containing protein n=1 Tax=Aquabacter spiritensis TaxID=933073 RepID=A0A4R3LSN3_9HYPH|nr:DUF1214 domain-containing protein [Aquabacter spiritensis]TCT03542.1 hypothetical protein EDC64_10992 [Aquabacter spiritensis]
MRLLPLAFTLAAAAALGLAATYAAVTQSRGLDVVSAGAWQGWPRSGTTQADPYARAGFARSGELPLELADGLMFLATHDSAGAPLDGRCDLRISGPLPQARVWTLTLMDAEGRLIANDAERYGFTSNEVVYRQDGTIDIVLSPRARAGNWIPTGARGRVKVALRLYDAPFSFSSDTGGGADLPRIATERCP